MGKTGGKAEGKTEGKFGGKAAKRAGPEPVEPVTIGNVRFEVVHWGSEVGSKQNGGHVLAYDVASGKQAWMVTVYQTKYEKKKEQDVQDVFITSLAERAGKLVVSDEEERSFLLDPTSRKVTPL